MTEKTCEGPQLHDSQSQAGYCVLPAQPDMICCLVGGLEMFGTFFIVPFSWEWKIIQKVTWLIFFRGVSSNHQPDLLRQSVSIRLLRRRNEVIRISRISRFQGFSGSFFWISYVLSVQSFKARKLQGIHDIYKPICNHSIIIQTIIILYTYGLYIQLQSFNHYTNPYVYIYIYNSHSKS